MGYEEPIGDYQIKPIGDYHSLASLRLVSERFWKMENRFWVIDAPDFKNMVIGFMAREELCCDGAELGMVHPSREVEMEVLVDILSNHDSVLLWDLHTRETLLMTKRVN
tara:strand:- start:97 stop:423 length:327 start_codon:yes stop_codon:yes gene_type:complete